FWSTGLLPLNLRLSIASSAAALPAFLSLLYGTASDDGIEPTAPEADDRDMSCIAFSFAAKSAAFFALSDLALSALSVAAAGGSVVCPHESCALSENVTNKNASNALVNVFIDILPRELRSREL